MALFELARARGQGRPVAFVVAEKRGRPYHAGKKSKEWHQGRGKPKGHGPHDWCGDADRRKASSLKAAAGRRSIDCQRPQALGAMPASGMPRGIDSLQSRIQVPRATE